MNLGKNLLVLTLGFVIFVALAYPVSAGLSVDAKNNFGGHLNLTGCNAQLGQSWDITGEGYYYFNTSLNVSYSGQGCVNIRSSNVVLSCTPDPIYSAGIEPRQYFTVTNIGNSLTGSAGINITQSDVDTTISPLQNITIQNCTISGWNAANGAGIFVGGFAWNVTFANVTFINNTVGLNVTGTALGINASFGNLNITRNHFTNNSAYHIFINNTFYSATYPICGSCYYNITNITVNNFTNGNATSFIAAIFLGNGSNSTIYRNNFSNLTNGIISWNITNFNITENNFSLINKTAIALYSSANNFNGSNNVSNNTIFNITGRGGAWGESAGIRINSSNNSIRFNIINVSNHSGINITAGANFTNITNNNVTNVSSAGISVWDSAGSNVSGNRITNVSAVGDPSAATYPRGYGIWVHRSNFTSLVYNFIRAANVSIVVNFTNTTNVTNNTANVTWNGSGIYVISSSSYPTNNITIQYNVVGNTTGAPSLVETQGAIYSRGIDGINIANNFIINTTWASGIVVANATRINVSHNELRFIEANNVSINLSNVDNVTVIRNDLREGGSDGIALNGSASPIVLFNTVLVAGRDALALYNSTGANVSENNFSESGSGIHAGLLGSNAMQVNNTLFQNNNLTGNTVGLNLTQIVGSRFENTRIWNSTISDQRFGNANVTHYNVSVRFTNTSLETGLAYYNISYIHYVNVTLRDSGGSLVPSNLVEFLSALSQTVGNGTTNADGNISLNLTIANQSNAGSGGADFSTMTATATVGSESGSQGQNMRVGEFDAIKVFNIQTAAPVRLSGGGGGGGSVQAIKPINQTKNKTGDTLNLTVSLVSGSLIKIKATANGSVPVSGVNLTVSPLVIGAAVPAGAAGASGVQYALTDGQGAAYVTLARVGNYTVTATKEGFKEATYKFTFKGKLVPLTTGLQVTTEVRQANTLAVMVKSGEALVPAATVRIVQLSTGEVIERVTNSNGETLVTLSNVGDYAMNVSKEGFGLKSSKFTFALGLKQSPAVLDISNLIRFPNTADVLISSNGKPVKGATVIFVEGTSSEPVYKTSDNEGYVYYELPNFGRYNVTASKDGYDSRNYEFVFHRVFGVIRPALRTVVRGTASGVSGIEVIVFSTNGTQVVNATATLSQISVGGQSSAGEVAKQAKQTDNDGIVRFSVGSGNYSITVNKTNFSQRTTRISYKNGAISIPVPSLDLLVEFGYPDRVTITILSNEDPVDLAIVDLSLQGSSQNGSRVSTPQSGKVTLRLPDKGNYTISATRPGYERATLQVSYADVPAPSDLKSLVAISLNLTNETRETLEGELQNVTVAKITITSNSTPVEEANVTFKNIISGEELKDVSDQDGKVSFEVADFGNYSVNISKLGYKNQVYLYSYGKEISLQATGLNVTTKLSYPSSARVSVTSNSAPVKDAVVTLSSSFLAQNVVKITDFTGIALFPLNEFGNYTVTTRKAGLGEDTSNFTYYGAIEPLEPTTSISSFIYCPRTGEITVVSDAESPEGAAVTLKSQSQILFGKLDNNGQANFTLTELGNYSVSAQKPGFEATGSFVFDENSCQFEEGREPLELTTLIICPNTIQVNVTANGTPVANALVRGYQSEVDENDQSYVISSSLIGKLTGSDGLANLTLRPPQPMAINFYTVNATATGHSLSDSIDFRYGGESSTCVEKIATRKAKRHGLLEDLLPFQFSEQQKPLIYVSILIIALLFLAVVLYGIRSANKEFKEWKRK